MPGQSVGPPPTDDSKCLSVNEINTYFSRLDRTCDAGVTMLTSRAYTRSSGITTGQLSIGADKDEGWLEFVASRRPIQTSSNSAGTVTTVVRRKNCTQPIASESTPLEDATSVRPTAASEERRAY